MSPMEYDERYDPPRKEPALSPTQEVERLLAKAKEHARTANNLYHRAKAQAKRSDYCEDYVGRLCKASEKLINKIHKIEAS